LRRAKRIAKAKKGSFEKHDPPSGICTLRGRAFAKQGADKLERTFLGVGPVFLAGPQSISASM
jgi:hypothetical protein